MKIIVVCMEHEYGHANRGYSYPYIHFYQTLKSLGHEVVLFDFFKIFGLRGKSYMNIELKKLVKEYNPKLVLFSLYQDEFYPDTIKDISLSAVTFSYFYDDTWRVKYTAYWGKFFTYYNTPNIYAINAPKLNKKIVDFSFGFNSDIFKKINIKKEYDISFVGSWHPYREWIINKLKKNGYSIYVAGYGWPNGPITTSHMVKIFNSSLINLNLSNSISWDLRYLLSSPRAIINNLRSSKNSAQLKARHFEINACNGFQLSFYCDGLNKFFDIDKEITVFINVDDLIDKVEYYLKHPEIIKKIASRGYKRALKNHSYQNRFSKFLRELL